LADGGAPLVAFRHIGKMFANGVVALRDVSFAVHAGTCHAICGENGAGKSTLMKVLFGLEQPTEGEVWVGGARLADNSPRLAAACGIGMVHQHFSLVPSVSVADNVALGREPRIGPLIDRAAARAKVRELAARYHLAVDPDAIVATLSVAAQQKVEILKALSHEVRLLILDEPTAVLTPQETQELFERLRHLKALGLTIIFISHKLREVRALADHVTVLRGGRVTGDAPLAVMDDATIARLVMGHVVRSVQRDSGRRVGGVLVSVRNLSLQAADAADRLHDVSLDIHAGEILGVAGVEGNGQRGLVSVLTGRRHPSSGAVTLDGQSIAAADTARLRRLGMAHLPSDRFREGGARTLSLIDNAIAGSHRAPPLARGPFLLRRECEKLAARMIATYDVRCRSPRQPLGSLSGGNVQKLIAAREFARSPRFLVTDQPTRGIDVQATAFIRERLIELADRGVAILLVTADLDELLSLSDRVIVLFGGRVVARLDNDATLTPERLGPSMLGLQAA
jgi:simple sugar transport system ATP-binding protein